MNLKGFAPYFLLLYREVQTVVHLEDLSLVRRAILKGFAPHIPVLYCEVPFFLNIKKGPAFGPALKFPLREEGLNYLAAFAVFAAGFFAAGFLAAAFFGAAVLVIAVTLLDKVCTRADNLFTSSAVGTPS